MKRLLALTWKELLQLKRDPISMKLMRRDSGVLVRSTAQARKAPIANASKVAASANDSVLPVVRQNAALPKART